MSNYWIEKIGDREVVCETCRCCGGKRVHLDREIRRVPQAVIDTLATERALDNDNQAEMGYYLLAGLATGVLSLMAVLGLGHKFGWALEVSLVVGGVLYFITGLGVLYAGVQRTRARSKEIQARIARGLYPHLRKGDFPSRVGTLESGAPIVLIPVETSS
jgi:hypothetical protein